MKRFTMYTMFAAAALTATAASVNAQTLNAEIPFAFQAGSTGMSAGSYDVAVLNSSGGQLLRVTNRDTHKSAILIHYAGDPLKAWRAEGKPKLGFECVENHCALRQVWVGYGPSMKLPSPKPGSEQAVQLTEIRMTRASGF